jgi:hypothetical protein
MTQALGCWSDAQWWHDTWTEAESTAANEMIDVAEHLAVPDPDAAVAVVMASTVPAQLHAEHGIGLLSCRLLPMRADWPVRRAGLYDDLLDLSAAMDYPDGYSARNIRIECLQLAEARARRDRARLDAITARTRYACCWHAWESAWLCAHVDGPGPTLAKLRAGLDEQRKENQA